MYEDQTYEIILERLLENTRDDIDKTEGSVLYTAKKTFAEVPAVLKDKVKEILIDLELPELAE